ncbi:multidrug efflux SMR transporter [Lysinibacillus sphaericus]|uniref:QacE family quaternary ammonium compound efflux SMR transporter n=2 Tax=Lysinibacillus TaxID=400634 RepID=A0A2S0K3C0_LYSSH|nr:MULTISPECIES: multidrug efflux SMR transporter [Lysinibacillus]AVK97867.1 QacE family quaternary ammonium compound efflux SMR transporter [Lysinibacillus sphaericus]MED4543361.1 multidrug efflux SMR transporter [Lysinibacillus sphaericus]TKI21102.1 multidrug efflux SMR transporter [Lysinibacillus sphaericus]TKI48253.1 multidrug efflux SMR transporter [Lysinibacillus tabacifolii]SUV16200.1 small multidrug resistance protein [Lysinibacillus sphaericus]
MKGYMALGMSIISEIVGVTMLKLSEGFTKLFPSIGIIVSFGLAFYFLSLCLKTVPLSLAYAIWSGVGTALTAVIGILFWREPFSIMTLVSIVLIIGGVVLLDASKSPEK